MARLANPVPRRRRGRTGALGAPHAAPPLADPTPFQPYSAVFGPGGVVREPSDTVAEKLAPISPAPAAGATPPRHSGGTSGNLTVPGYTPETPTGAPYDPAEPGHSAADFAAAFRAKAAAERRHRALELLPSLKAPTAAVAPGAVDKLAQAAGGLLGGTSPLEALLAGTTAAAKAVAPHPSLLGQLPKMSGDNLVSLVPTTSAAADEVKYRAAIGANGASAQHPKQTVAELFNPAGPAVGANPGYNEPFTPGQLENHKQTLAEINHTLLVNKHGIVGAREIEAARGGTTKPVQAGGTTLADLYKHAGMHQEHGSWIGGDPSAFGAALKRFTPAQQATLLNGGAVGGRTVQAPNQVNPADPLGAKTLGNITEQQLEAAAKAGTLHINKKGVLSVPATRSVLANLLAAHKALQNSRTLPKVNPDGSLEPDEIGALLVEEGRKAGIHLTPAEVAEGIGVAEAESGGDYAANVAQGSEGHIGLFSESPAFGSEQERLDPRAATKAALEEFTGDERSWNPAWVHWQEIQGEDETGADRAPQYRSLAKELVEGGKEVDPAAVKQLVDAKHAAVKAGINPTPWNGDVEGGGGQKYVYIRADAKGAVNWVKSAIGTQEGSPKQVHWAELENLGPSEPWCSDFVSVALARRGVELPDNPNGSWEYEDSGWKGGTQLGTDLSKAKPGDLVVYGGGAHIAMYVGNGKVVAGNWGDEVVEYGADEDSRGISAIVRPHYKGGKVKVKAGSLPGSSSDSTFGGESSGGESAGSTSAPVSSEGGAPGGDVTGNTAAREQGQQALASFTPLAAPTLGVNSFAREPSEAEELLKLLTQASSRVNRA